MNPDERDRVNELFDKLETLERSPRERDAERVIAEGLQRAPHAVYPLVQTVLVQDEALKQADARIRELETELGYDAQPRREGGFLDNMRDAIFGAPRRGSVPPIRPGDAPMGAPRVWGNTSQQPMQQQPQQQEPQQGVGRGSSFLGTAAASAAGMIGGYMLMNSLGGMFGGGQAHAAHDRDSAGSGSPWGGGGDSSNSGLAKDAGLNDMGGSGERRGFFDSDAGQGGDDFGGDFGGGGD